MPFAGRFVVKDNFVINRIGRRTSSRTGRDFWAVLRNLAPTSIPHPSESVSPILPTPAQPLTHVKLKITANRMRIIETANE
jgi:hypothetical protein